MKLLASVALLLELLVPLGAQTTLAAAAKPTPRPTASIAGSVRNETGARVSYATVTISTQGFEQHKVAGIDGSFQFTNLRSGKYTLCAHAPAVPGGNPFVDSCLWQDRSTPPIALRTGQSLTDVRLAAKRGHLLKIRVNDPARQLPGTTVGRTGGIEMAVHLFGPSGLAQPVPIVGVDRLGREHAIVIPFDTPHRLVVHSSTHFLRDDAGGDIDETRPRAITIATGTRPQPANGHDVVITLQGRRP